MKNSAPAFSAFEFQIAWRYLRAKRSEGGVSAMTWISLIGIALAVAALIIVLAVRTGFRNDFVDTILGSGAHASVYHQALNAETGRFETGITDFDAQAALVRSVPGVTHAAPVVKGQALASFQETMSGVQVFGLRKSDLESIPNMGPSDLTQGSLDDFENGIAIGRALANQLGVTVGQRIKLISPNGSQTAFGRSLRVKNFTVAYVFSLGRHDLDLTRVYLPLEPGQSFFDMEGKASEIEVYSNDPEAINGLVSDIMAVLDDRAYMNTWRDFAGGFLRALEVEDNVMFIIMSVLILLATMNIVSGLIMLVKNKGSDIGILRTMGLSQGSILRVFFICGAGIGVIGTILGLILGVLFVLNIEFIFNIVNGVGKGDVWDPSRRGLYQLPAELRIEDIVKAISLSLGLSFIITIFPARRAARMNPVEALRYE